MPDRMSSAMEPQIEQSIGLSGPEAGGIRSRFTGNRVSVWHVGKFWKTLEVVLVVQSEGT